MKVRIEILRFEKGHEPKVMGAITHEAHALPPVAAAAQGVVNSGELPYRADAYRIVTETGAEYYGWPDRANETAE